MIKKLLIVIVLIGAAWSIPPIRSRLTIVAGPLLEKLGPAGQKLLKPARNYAAKTQETAMLRMLAEEHNEGRDIPEPRTFVRWMKKKTGKEPVDPWGNRYWLERQKGSLAIGSNGADGFRESGDDVKQTVPF